MQRGGLQHAGRDVPIGQDREALANTVENTLQQNETSLYHVKAADRQGAATVISATLRCATYSKHICTHSLPPQSVWHLRLVAEIGQQLSARVCPG